MNIDQIITIVSFILAVAVFAWGLYQKVKGNATASVSELIALAETTGLPGKEKMAFVVASLYEHIPAAFKKFLSQETLERIAQWIFDYMKKYALAYVDSHADKPEAIHEVNVELANDLVAQIDSLGEVGIKDLAVKLGIEIAGMSTSEITAAILAKLIERNP